MSTATVAALRAQLQQLAGLYQAGELDEAAYIEARVALERRIVEAVVDAPEVIEPARRSTSKVLPIGLALFVGLVAVAGYVLFGAPKAPNPALRPASAPAAASAAASGMVGGHPVDSAQIAAMIDRLAARLKERPQDVDGWAMLGRSYAVLGRHAEAVPAFEKAVALRPDDAVLLADYADALTVANGHSLEGEPARLIARALKIEPNNLKALSLAGTAAFDRKDYAGALLHWDKLVQLAPDSPFVQQIRAGIDAARKQTGGPPMAPAGQASAQRTPAAGASVSGVVTLAAALAAKAAPQDTLFVFARPAEGSRMPLAILRKQVKDLPLAFTLDDSMAVSPTARLSSAKSVVVGARISKRGDASAMPGDLQGLSAPVSTGANGLKIEIVEVVAP